MDMERKNEVASVPDLRLYRRTPRTLLELGSGAGHNAAYLKGSFSCTF